MTCQISAKNQSLMSLDSAATQLKNSIMADIRRFAEESDVSVCEALGVLRMVENDLINMINSGANEYAED